MGLLFHIMYDVSRDSLRQLHIISFSNWGYAGITKFAFQNRYRRLSFAQRKNEFDFRKK